MSNVKVTATLLTSQKNEIFRKVERRGLDPAAFHWGEVTLRTRDQARYTVPALVHSATGFYFGFGGRGPGGDFLIYFSPDPRGYGWDPSETWSAVMGWVETWLKNLRQEVDQRDLWEELISQRSSLQVLPAHDDNIPFTPDERQRISETLARVEAHIAISTRLSLEQSRLFHEKLEEMRIGAERLGRKDWRMYALGTLTSLIISAAFDPDQARTLVQEVVQALAWLAAHAPSLPVVRHN